MFGKSLTASWPAGAQIAAASVVAIGGLSLTTSGVWAALQAAANNTPGMTVTSGTLSLTMGTVGTGGLTTAISNMAPGDIVYRYVDLTSAGLNASGMTFSATGTGSTNLTTQTTGLNIGIQRCDSGTWTTTNTTTTGICSGTTSVALAATAVSALSSGSTLLLMPATITPAVTPLHFRIAISLPDQIELRTNNGTPTQANGSALTNGTIQGLSTTLTTTFTETQVAGTPSST